MANPNSNSNPNPVGEVKARLGDLRISPRKVRLVTDLLRRKTFLEAVKVLTFLNKKSARPVLKLLNSAAANARNNFQLDPANMRIKSVTVNAGRVMERFMPRAQGRAFPINRRTSIVEVILAVNSGFKSTDTKSKALSKKDVSKVLDKRA